ncbi:tRNA (cytidine(34)-2'-O)-methyltransferase [Tundrisphaera sp. TA3]|uniref:tRNA (cytidine(34)-2'-O)-methyltransferase n=1 Tax=Tundrisphaera sp. TA3 TaxID=3435775 RepID=UPI003EBA00D3
MSEEPEIARAGDASAAGAFHVILVEPEIAGNVGAIGRTCVAAGAILWMVRPLGFHLTDRHIRRAGLDYWPHLTYRVVDHMDEVVEALGDGRLWSFTTKTRRSFTEAAYRPGDGLVFGPESRGLASSWLATQGDQSVRIPIRPEARSLNLGTAVAIGLFEAVRQAGAPG